VEIGVSTDIGIFHPPCHGEKDLQGWLPSSNEMLCAILQDQTIVEEYDECMNVPCLDEDEPKGCLKRKSKLVHRVIKCFF
jgi:hypothetical protein